MEAIKKLRNKKTGRVISIFHDPDATSPRENCNLGKILYRANRSYVLGDEEASEEEIKRILDDTENYIAIPVYTYIHSDVTMRASDKGNPFGCPWDSAQSGVIYVSKEDVRKEWKVSRISPKLRETVIKGLKLEIETFDKWARGEFVGFEVTDAAGAQLDS